MGNNGGWERDVSDRSDESEGGSVVEFKAAIDAEDDELASMFKRPNPKMYSDSLPKLD